MYLEENRLQVHRLGRGFAWMDAGTVESLLAAANFVATVEERQGVTISAPEEIAFVKGWISKEKLAEAAEAYGKSAYGAHLKAVAEGRINN